MFFSYMFLKFKMGLLGIILDNVFTIHIFSYSYSKPSKFIESLILVHIVNHKISNGVSGNAWLNYLYPKVSTFSYLNG